MSSTPTAQAITTLYKSTLRTAQSYSTYNFRTYFVRKTEEKFRSIQKESDPAKLSTFYDEAVKELAVMKRGAIVNQLYGGWKLVVEKQEPVHERGDT